MLGYQHIYHAGNFADVHKHGILAHLLATLAKRPQALFILDTHAGRGLYDLDSSEARKKQEYMSGISALDTNDTTASPLTDFINVLQRHNPEGGFKRYPGSAQLAKDFSRPQDRLFFAELHPGEFSLLQKNFPNEENIKLLHKSGFECMAEMIPPQERRGLIIIDPPYEIKTDYAEVPKAIAQAWKKWAQGVFFLWYPMLPAEQHTDMLQSLQRSGLRDVLISEIWMEDMRKSDAPGMYGSGLVIVNPPWPESVPEKLTQYIAATLPAKTSSRVFWLDNATFSPETGKLSI